MCSSGLDNREVTFGQHNLVLVVRTFAQDIAIGIADERTSPKFELPFAAHSIRGSDVDAIRDGVAAHHSFPCRVLTRAEFFLFGLNPTDCRWIEQNLRSS